MKSSWLKPPCFLFVFVFTCSFDLQAYKGRVQGLCGFKIPSVFLPFYCLQPFENKLREPLVYLPIYTINVVGVTYFIVFFIK